MGKALWLSLRPKQWLKNVMIFAGLIFSQNLFDPSKFILICAAFIVYSFASSSLYLLNDVLDIEHDRKHPTKKKRPIAAGELSVLVAILFAFILGIGSLIAAFILSDKFFVLLSIYLIIQILYSFYLKQVVILDVFCIAFGFLLRVLAGAIIIDAPISSWLLICTIFLSLFLALGKRREELVLLELKATSHRRVLSEYSLSFIDQLITIVTASAIFSYVLYTFSTETISKFHTKDLRYTIVFVLYGIFRYLYLIYIKKMGGAPEKVLIGDKPLLVNCLLYIGAVVFLIY